jgi:hypothetical protein
MHIYGAVISVSKIVSLESTVSYGHKVMVHPEKKMMKCNQDHKQRVFGRRRNLRI